jgi:hypothetical protein
VLLNNRQVIVGIDDRIRLMSAVLAVTNYPERAQQRKGHRPHAHARRTTQWLWDFRNHPGVQGAQYLLNKGAPLQALYTYALKLDFPSMRTEVAPKWIPEGWNYYLRDFFEVARLQDLWDQEQPVWDQAQNEADSVLRGSDYYDFLEPFIGDVREYLIYMPNVSYPSETSVGVRVWDELICIGPPRIAWGDNPPWPFDEDRAHIFSTSLSDFTRLLMLAWMRRNADFIHPIAQKPLPLDEEFREVHPNWGDQFLSLFVPGAVALYLEARVDPQEAKSFILMEKKIRGLTILPGVISVLERYLREYYDGRYDTLLDYLPHFPGHLRVAKKISAI